MAGARNEVDQFWDAGAASSMVSSILDLDRIRAVAAWRTACPRLGTDVSAQGRDARPVLPAGRP